MKKILVFLLILLIPCVSLAENLPDVSGMMPVLDSLTLALMQSGEEGSEIYEPHDSDFFWTVLYLMGVNWSAKDPSCEINGDIICMPAQLLRAYASAAFSVSDGLLPLPEGSTIRYDDIRDEYLLPLSDRGDADVKLVDVYCTADGVNVVAQLVDSEDVPHATVYFELVDYTTIDNTAEMVFQYAVTKALLDVAS